MLLSLFGFFLCCFQGQPRINDGLCRDLISLFVQEVKGVNDCGTVIFHSSVDGENEVFEIRLEPYRIESDALVRIDTGKKNESAITPENIEDYEDDFPFWKIVLTEGRFNPYLTCKYDGGDNDITDIEEVMLRFDIDSIDEKWLDNHVLFEVDTLPVLLDGEESIVLSKIIEESFVLNLGFLTLQI